MTTYKYIILGGGLTAGYAAQEFTEMGVASDELCILSAEKTAPYERPPLSKSFLAGEESIEEIFINSPDFYEENGIELKLDSAVKSVNLDQKRLYTDDDAYTYEKLLIATGSSPHTFDLPGADLDNIFYLRQIGDAKRIRDKAKDAAKAVVIGGSFISMETTAVLQSGGVDVTMVFPEDRVWDAFFTPQMSDFFERYYRERGVTILPGEGIDSFEGVGTVSQIVTKSGKHLPADMVVCGIGVSPNSQLFRGMELKLSEGFIEVNRFMETNLPDVYAAGDITYYRDVVYDQMMHVEHWDNAVQQGRLAARGMMGKRERFEHVPYFFSDVFDLSYEFWGDTTNAVETVHRGDLESGRFSVWWLGKESQVLAAFVMDRPEEEREIAPKLILEGGKLPESF